MGKPVVGEVASAKLDGHQPTGGLGSMIDKFTTVRTPLGVVGVFAAFAEVAACYALPKLEPSTQGIFIWFVMVFPVALIALFFATLNWNHTVFYAPSDFSNERNFMTIAGLPDKAMINDVRRRTLRIHDAHHSGNLEQTFQQIKKLAIMKLRPSYESWGCVLSENVRFSRGNESVEFDAVAEEPRGLGKRLIEVQWVPNPAESKRSYEQLIRDLIPKGEMYAKLTGGKPANIALVVVVPDKEAESTEFLKHDLWNMWEGRKARLGYEGWVFSYDEIGFVDQTSSGGPREGGSDDTAVAIAKPRGR